MRLTGVLSAILMSFMWGMYGVQAQDEPSYPDHPTEEACQEYKSRYADYLSQLRNKARDCQIKHEHDPGYYDPRNDIRIRCSPVAWPKVCATEIEQSACAHSVNFGLKEETCFTEARKRERADLDAKEKRLKENQQKLGDQLKREQCKTDSVFPKSPACERPEGPDSGSRF
jgi:hypothetical protein